MRLHLTIKDESMVSLRKMAIAAGCTGKTDRNLLQAYLHHLTNVQPPQWGGARKKPKKAGKKTKNADF